MSTYGCLKKLTLTPINFEKLGQIVSFGVPNIFKIRKGKKIADNNGYKSGQAQENKIYKRKMRAYILPIN